MAAAPTGVDDGQGDSQGQAQAPPPEASCLHMLAKTVLPPSVYTRAVSGNFSGGANGATACSRSGGDDSRAAVTGSGPTEVVLATATSLLLISVAAAMPEAELAAAAAVGALADAMVDHDMAPAAGDSEDGDEADDRSAAHQVLCEQTAFGAVVAIAAFRHPHPAESQDLAQDLLLLLLAHSPQLLALRFDREFARFLPVTRIDCGLGSSFRGYPAKLEVAPGGSAIAVAPRRGDPVVLLPGPAGGFLPPMAVPLAAANATLDAPPNAAAVADLRAAVDLAPPAPKPADVLSICFADGTLPVALVLARFGGPSLSLWQCWHSAGHMQCALIMELVVVTSWPGSHMRSIPPQVFPTTPFAIDAVPGHPTGVLLLAPLEARVVSWGAVAAADSSSSQSPSSLQMLARWRLDGGDPADIGFAAARQMQRDGMSRDLCAAWAWDKADANAAGAAAQPSGGAADGDDGSDPRQECSAGSQWMVVDVTCGRLPEDALQGTCSGVDAATGATETTEHGMPSQQAASGAAHAMAATPPPPQQRRQQRQPLTDRLLVASSGDWIQSFSGSGCDGPVAPVEGRTWWLLALQGGQLLASTRDGGADLLQRSVSTDGAAADRQRVLPGGGAARGGMVVADLAGLGQPQAYTVCRGSDESSGSLRVTYPRPVPETVFESGADYGGVIGIWAVAARPADATHALVVLSFVSGSRALSIADGELSDATEAVALAADECTIAAGCIGDLLAAQVTASRIQLCGLASVTGGGATASGSGGGSQEAAAEGDGPDSPRPSLGKRHASWATMEGIADTFASRLVPFSDDVSSAPLPSPSRRRSEHQALLGSASGGHSGGSGSGSFSGAGSGFVAELFGSSGECSSRGPEDVWRPAGGSAIRVAAVVPGVVFYSCAGGKVLHAIALRRRAVDGGEGSGSGKRKRCSGGGWRLAPIASAPVAAELSCIDCMAAPGVQGGLLIAVGTHEPAVELLLLRPAASLSLPPLLVPLGCLDLAPPRSPPLPPAVVHPRQRRRRALLAAALGLTAEEGGSGEGSSAAGTAALHRGSIPESVQLLPGAGAGAPCEILVGLRSGALLRSVAQPAATAAGGSNGGGGGGGGVKEDMADAEAELLDAQQTEGAACDRWDFNQVGHVQQLGSLPAGLVPLPASSGDSAPALALVLGERPFVVRRQPGAAHHADSISSGSCSSNIGNMAAGSGMQSTSSVIGGGGAGGGAKCGCSLLAEGLPTAEALCALRLTQATALTLPGEEPRTLVLGAGGDGRLRLLDIGSAVRTRHLLLSPARSSAAAAAQPQDGFQPAAADAITGQGVLTPAAPAPTLLAAAPLQGLLIVACSPAEGSVAPSIVAVQPATGEVVAQCELACDEEVTALAAWPTHTAPFARSTTISNPTAAPLPGSQTGSGQAGAAAAAAAAAVLATQTDPAPASGLPRFSAQHFQPPDVQFPPAQTAGSAPTFSFAEGAGGATDFVAVGTSCIQPPPAPWYVPAGRRGRLLLLRLQAPGRDGSRQGWRLVAEEVLQLAEPVTQLAPAGVPGFLLAGIGSGLAAYRLVRRRVGADRHGVGSVDGGSTRVGRADDDDDDVSSHAAGHAPVPRHWRVSEEAAARRHGRQPHPPPPPAPPAAPPQPQQQERQQQQQQQLQRPQRPLRPAAAAAAIAAAVPAGDREAGWGFEARRRAARKLPGGSGSFDGVSDGGAPAAASAGGSATTEEIPQQRWLEHWGLARHAWKRLSAPVASLNVDATTSAIAVADARNPVRLLGFDPLGDPPFAVLRLDRAARTVVAAAALPPQPPDQAAPAQPRCVDCGCVVSLPEAACAVACNAAGGIVVLVPDTAHRGPEASMNVAACYNLGCPAACAVPGSLGFEGLAAQDLTLGRSAGASETGLTAAGAPRAAGADAPPAASPAEVTSPAFLVASLDGAVTAAAPLSRDLHALLAALEAAMDAAQPPSASPISGACHATLRECSSVVRAAAVASASPPPARMVDGDLLQHFLRLPEPQQQALVAHALDTLERSQNPDAALPPGSTAAALALPELGGGGQSAGTLEADTRLVASHVEALLSAMQ